MNLPSVRAALLAILSDEPGEPSMIDLLDAHERGWLDVCTSGRATWWVVTEAGRKQLEAQ